jgi:glyoxylase-like metal-dependent hydrolase (beta-lactamase superfamily II)
MASTLIYGARDAVLVDAFMTVKQANALADWVGSKGKNLTTIYITHGHGDHWFGVGTLLERFPNARAVATPNTVKVMRQNASPEVLQGAWQPGFPGQIPADLVIAEELKGNVIDLEGHELVAVELGHTDTDHTTCLHVPAIGLVVAGDAAYNDVHLYLSESNAQTRQEWIAALDKIESLNPHAVVASHKRPDNEDNPRIIEETRQYIRDFDRLAETTGTAQELYDKIMELYPNRVNPGWALWSSTRTVKSDDPERRKMTSMTSKQRNSRNAEPREISVPQATGEPFQSSAARREEIRRRAYEIYLERGGQPGHDLDDWLQAERELEPKVRPAHAGQYTEYPVAAAVAS